MSRLRTDRIVSSDTTSSVDFPNGLSSAGITVNGSIVKTAGTSLQYFMVLMELFPLLEHLVSMKIVDHLMMMMQRMLIL